MLFPVKTAARFKIILKLRDANATIVMHEILIFFSGTINNSKEQCFIRLIPPFFQSDRILFIQTIENLREEFAGNTKSLF
jgi:hypothetical protein